MTLDIGTPRWFTPVLEGNPRYIGIHGGRASGKSHSGAEWIVEGLLMDPHLRAVAIRETQKSLSYSIKQLIEDKIYKFKAQDYFIIQRDTIKAKYGTGRIIFIGMQDHNSDSIKSLEGYKRFIVEESQNISQRSLDLLRPTIRAGQAQAMFLWNPRFPTDPVDDFFRGEVKHPDAITIQVNYMDNPWFDQCSLAEDMEYDKRKDPDKYQHIWLGGYEERSDSRVFNNWRIEEFDTPDDTRFYFGADWGFAQDPTVLVRCFLSVESRKLWIDYEAYQVGCEIVNTPDLFLTIPEAEKWPIGADSARPETISHLRKHGFPKIYPAIKGPGSIQDGISFLQGFEMIVHPRCTHTIDNLSYYRYKIDRDGKVLPILRDESNDVIDSLRYAVEPVRRLGTAQKKINIQPGTIKNYW